MTKRDTIIVTALVNAGLLVILFVSALKTERGTENLVVQSKMPNLSSSEVVVKNETKKILGDEVDVVLKQYAEQNPLQVSPATRSLSLQAPASFVEDLQLATQPTAQSAPSFLSTEPAPILPPEPAVSLPEVVVVVKKGDVLEKIAKQNSTTVTEIMKKNNLVSTQLKIGQTLKMPAPKEKVSVKEESTKPLDPTSAKYYVVKSGDNLWTIAVKNHIKVEDLLKLNGLNEEKARKLKPGDRIRIQ